MIRQAYPSDLSDAQWEVLEPLLPATDQSAPNSKYERREIVNAILYVLRSGCPWRLLPHDLPAWGTVYWYFRRWRREGIWDQVLASLRSQVRQQAGRQAEPSAGIIDSQSIKTSAVRGPEKGYDAGKKSMGANAMSWLIRKGTCWQSKSLPPAGPINKEPNACWSRCAASLRVCPMCGGIVPMGAR